MRASDSLLTWYDKVPALRPVMGCSMVCSASGFPLEKRKGRKEIKKLQHTCVRESGYTHAMASSTQYEESGISVSKLWKNCPTPWRVSSNNHTHTHTQKK